MDKSVLATMLQTCKKTETPPIPIKKEAKTKLYDMSFINIFEIPKTPSVISIMPVARGEIKAGSIFKKLKRGVNKFWISVIIPHPFKIVVTHENTIIKPPIIRIVEIAEVML